MVALSNIFGDALTGRGKTKTSDEGDREPLVKHGPAPPSNYTALPLTDFLVHTERFANQSDDHELEAHAREPLELEHIGVW